MHNFGINLNIPSSYTLGNAIVKEAKGRVVHLSKWDEPLTRAIIGAGLGGILGASYADAHKENAYLNEHDKAERKLAQTLRGALLGSGVGLASSVLGMNVSDTI